MSITRSFYFLALILILYSKSVFFGLCWDDEIWTTHNIFFNSGVTFSDVVFSSDFYQKLTWFRPFYALTFYFDFKLHSFSSFWMHLENIIFFWGLGLILFSVLSNIFVGNKNRAFWATTLFLVLPIHTEVVAFVSGRDSLLNLFFVLLGFLYYQKLYLVTSRDRHWTQIFFVGVCIFISLGFKESGLLCPVLYSIWAFIYYRESLLKNYKRDFLLFLVPVFVFWVWKKSVLIAPVRESNFFWQRSLVEVSQSATLFFRYLKSILLPNDLKIFYGYPEVPLGLCFIFLSLMVIIIVWIIKRKDRVLCWSLCWYIVCLLPFLQLIKLYHFQTDRWALMSSVGLITFITQCMYQLKRKYFLIIMISFSVLYGYGTSNRVNIWKNNETLFLRALEQTPNWSHASFNLGNYYFKNKQLDKAKSFFEKSLADKPSYGALTNLGYVYLDKGENEKAIFCFEQVVDIENPYAKKGLKLAKQRLSQSK